MISGSPIKNKRATFLQFQVLWSLMSTFWGHLFISKTWRLSTVQWRRVTDRVGMINRVDPQLSLFNTHHGYTSISIPSLYLSVVSLLPGSPIPSLLPSLLPSLQFLPHAERHEPCPATLERPARSGVTCVLNIPDLANPLPALSPIPGLTPMRPQLSQRSPSLARLASSRANRLVLFLERPFSGLSSVGVGEASWLNQAC